jgi:hypothetical protein
MTITPPRPDTRQTLWDRITTQHRDMRDRLRALNQAAHDGADPREVEAVRRALWTLHNAGRSS